MTVTPEQLGGGDVARRQAPPTTPNVVVVTEHQVMLGSAIAISTPAPLGRRLRGVRQFLHVVHRVITWSPETAERGKRKSYPRRTPSWYSDALMAREMRRL